MRPNFAEVFGGDEVGDDEEQEEELVVGEGGVRVSRRTGASASVELGLSNRSIEDLESKEFWREREEETDCFRSSEVRAA